MSTKRWILLAAVLASGIVFLDSIVVNVALPRMGRDLPRSFLGVLEGQSYVYNAYLLALSSLLVLAGALTDFYGRRRMVLMGLVGFGVTSVLCGLAPTMELLVLFRILQGAAGALLVPGSLALLTANFSGEEQGTIGYAAAAAGAVGIPGSLFLIFFSRRFGSLAARFGPRWFMAAGPLIMALGILWFARVPSTSTPWKLHPADPSTYLPPLSYLTDFLPGTIVFGVGLMVMVAPLTTALMTSVPVRNSGIGSAINNAISRVGPQLAGALVFVFLTANFYATLAPRLPGVDALSSSFRNQVSPLNTPADPQLIAIVRDASTSSFHLAMLVGAGFLLAGALVNAIGILNAHGREQRVVDAQQATPAGA